MSSTLNWGASLGSQFLAELSLIEAEVKKQNPSNGEAPVVQSCDIISETQTLVKGSTNSDCEKRKSGNAESLGENMLVPSLSSTFSLVESSGPSQGSRKQTVSSHSPLLCSTPIGAVSIRKASLRSSTLSQLQLQNWGLPPAVVEKYREKKITNLFPWQVDCLRTGLVLKGGNLVYSAPTSSGKTLVSELLMLKTVIEKKKKGLYILPFVAVAKEKAKVLKGVTEEVGIRIESFAGSTSPPGGLKNVDLAICTIEKANGLINRMIEEGSLHQLGIVVVDELHLIGDSHRGYLLELLLTKVLYASLRSNDRASVQIVGMSATLPDLELLAQWLRADLYRTDFRPIPLKEHIKIGSEILYSNLQPCRKIEPSLTVPNDVDDVAYLCLETLLQGHSVLIFCPTKNWCEKMAQTISSIFFNLGSSAASHYGAQLRQQLNGDSLSAVLEALKSTPAGMDPVLGQTVRFGVAFHHAGLTCEEREIIETAFRRSVVRVLVATSTLSSGVNLPARRVIIRTPIFHGAIIDPLVYRQMIGRAGRYGVDTDGESFLICKPSEKHQVERMFSVQPAPLKSCLLLDSPRGVSESISVSSSMKRAMLEIIATGSASSLEDLKLYASCTLLSALHQVPDAALGACVDWLVTNEFIRRQQVADDALRLGPTQLGLASLASSLSPDESLVLLNELQTARKGIILDSDLHLVYQITPTYVADQMNQIDWLHYLTLWEDLKENQKRVGEAVGVEERFLVRAMKGTVSTVAPRQSRQMAIHRRFYTALALHDLMSEVRLSDVALLYKCNKGMLQALQQQTASFAGMVTIFCQRLGWNTLNVLLEHFQSRLLFGVQLELCDLMRLASMEAHTARLLYNAGVANAVSLATASPANIEMLLKNSVPFESGGAAAKSPTLNPVDARVLVDEARQLLQLELGVKINWSQREAAPPLPKQFDDLRSDETMKRTQQPVGKEDESAKLNSALEESILLEATDAADPLDPEFPSTPVTNGTGGKENQRPIHNITPDLFQDADDLSSSFREGSFVLIKSKERSQQSLRDSMDSMQTPRFAACAEVLLPVTERNTNKRRLSVEDNSMLEATQTFQSIGRLVAKKTKPSTPSIGSWDDELLDSSVIPSTNPSDELSLTEIDTDQRLEAFVQESLRNNCISLSLFKEKQSVVGLAVAWSAQEVNYIGVRERHDSALDTVKVKKLKKWLNDIVQRRCKLVVFDVRTTVKELRTLFPRSLKDVLFQDVELCHWVYEPSSTSMTLNKLSKMYTQSVVSPSKGYRGRARCLCDCRVQLDIYERLKQHLRHNDLWQAYAAVEMPVVSIMLRMEDTGLGFDRTKCQRMLHLLRGHLKELEERAHRLAGRCFSLTNSKETTSVITKDLKLQVEDVDVCYLNPLKKKYKPVTVSKLQLVKLGRRHPLPGIVVQFRKINAIIQTILCPLLQAETFHHKDQERIAGECEFRTVTGRITMSQPNLQHIPRPFQLSDGQLVNIRTSFCAPPGKTLLSADYSQLELRILAHLSEDAGLCSILGKSCGDVFRTIASSWKKKAAADVTDEERQHAKQICYGIVYGMGVKTLADQLEVTEEEALLFIDSFHSAYPSIQKFISSTVSQCRCQGYVVTLNGRRRFLPAINSNNLTQRAQAERQAVNTKIQGSASDLVKAALILLHGTLSKDYPDVHLVHQIHDELLFEIPTDMVMRVAHLVERCMETAIPMKIRFPVALKTGPSWGDMEPFKINRSQLFDEF